MWRRRRFVSADVQAVFARVRVECLLPITMIAIAQQANFLICLWRYPRGDARP